MSPLTWETILRVAEGRLELDGPHDPLEQDDPGGDSSSLQELAVEDLKVEQNIKMLPEYLAMLGSPAEIIRMHNDVFPDRPELKIAKRADCDGACESCDTRHGTSCEEEEGEKT
jgi:hypothetical protein